MAKQGNQGNQAQPGRDRDGNLGRPGNRITPTGTSGRQSGSDVSDTNPPRRNRNHDDDEPGLGNRSTNN